MLGVGNGTISEVIRSLRDEMGRVMAEDYIRTARAKGASVWKHSFKEGLLIPVTEIIAAKIPFILGGAVIVEQVFNWPGMGRMAWQAAQDRDYPGDHGHRHPGRRLRAHGEPVPERGVRGGESESVEGMIQFRIADFGLRKVKYGTTCRWLHLVA